MTYQYLAFFMGLFGSLHCAVMCGPLLFATQGKQPISWWGIFSKVVYQIGRIATYGLLGFLIGLFGNVAQMQGAQQTVSIISGIFLIIIAASMLIGKRSAVWTKWQTRVIQPFAKLMSRWIYKPGGSFFAGILNGLLPCGMVYMALTAALNADSIAGSIEFMVLFGMGTIPLMLLIALVSSYSKQIFKVKFNKIIPLFYFVMGCWFILRGANLDIPYLSPMLYMDGASYCQ